MVTREQLEQREELYLAPYAMKNSATRGRLFAEPKHPYRLDFQRDRDRIIHTTAFRRLEYKTQVFVYSEGDHYRNRLTHSIEVAQIGRTLARGAGYDAWRAGTVRRDGDRHAVEIPSLDLVFDAASLQLR